MMRIALLCGWLLAMLAVSAAGPAAAQDVTVQASASATTVGENETVTYAVEVRGAAFDQIETPAPPQTTGLALQQRTPSIQRQLAYTNGQAQRSVRFEWRYEPLRTGSAAFEEATVVVRGRSHVTAAIDLRVVPQAQRPAAPPAAGTSDAAGEPSIFGEDALFVRAELSDERAYLGEQVVLTYRLYFREDLFIEHSRLAGSWGASGFWQEEMEVAPRPVPRTETVDGARYQVIILKRVALFPTRTGTLTVDPLRIETTARRPPRRPSMIDRLFALRGASETVPLASEAVQVHVRPLPEGAPPTFAGSVGSYEMEAALAPTDAAAGEALQLRLRISGNGNVATLAPLALELPASFEVYDPQTETTIRRIGRAARGTARLTYTLVPRREGTYALAPITFTYFDPEEAAYKTAEAALPAVRVEGSVAAEALSETGAGLPLNDVAPLMTAARWQRRDVRPLYRQWWPYAALALPALLLGAFALYRRRETAAEAPAPPGAEAHLREAEAQFRAHDARAGYRALERGVYAAAAARAGRPAASLRRDEMDALLAEKGVPRATRQSARALLDAYERARFAPASAARQAARQAARADLERARLLVEDLRA